MKYTPLPKPKINDHPLSSSQQKKSKTDHKLKLHTHGFNVRAIQSKLILGKVQMKANLLYILDIIPWTVEFKWFVIESFSALDSANVNISNIKKCLNWVQLAPCPPP